MGLRRFFLAIMGFALLGTFVLGLSYDVQTAGAPLPDYTNSLWISASEGIIKVGTVGGSVLLKVTDPGEVRAVAVDEEAGRLWAFGSGKLHAFGFNGEPLLSVTISADQDAGNVALSVDPLDGALWLGVDKNLYRVNTEGAILLSLSLSQPVQAMAMDRLRANLWVATKKTVTSYDQMGNPVSAVEQDKNADVQDIVFDPVSDLLWIAAKKSLLCYGGDGAPRIEAAIDKIECLAIDGQGGVWVADKKSIARVDYMGQILFQLDPFEKKGDGSITDIVLDPSDHTVWIIDHKQLSHVSAEGEVLQVASTEPASEGRLWNLAIYADLLSPALQVTAPQDESHLNTLNPTIELAYSDAGSGVDLSSLAFLANDDPLSVSCIFEEEAASCTPTTALSEGPLTLSITIKDYAGNQSDVVQVSFTVDTTPPEIVLDSPAEDLLTNQAGLTVSGHLSETAELLMNAQSLPLDSNLNFTETVTLREGMNSFTFSATDAAGNNFQLISQVILDTAAPPIVDAALTTVSVVTSGQVTVIGASGSVEAGAKVKVINLTSEETKIVTAESDGSFTLQIGGQAGDSLSILVIDGAGNQSSSVSINVNGGLPPAAETIPEGSFGDNYRELVPLNATITEYAPNRFSLITGMVNEISGATLADATVSVHGHPEYGSTTTDAQGRFTLPVEGGGLFTVSFTKPGYLGAHRQLATEWNQIHTVETVLLTKQDTVATTIEFDGDPATRFVHQSTPCTDEDGTRSTTLVFCGDTEVIIQDPQGNEMVLSEPITVRATEFVKPQAMPALLPLTSAFTFAADLTVDGIDPKSQVRFSKPVVMYVDNFLEFPVGEVVPVGYYDRLKALWAPYDNGLVVKLLDTNGDGLTDALDATGDGKANDLNKDGGYADEVAGVSGNSAYAPGKTYWRVSIDHFTPWDCNWPWDFPTGAVGPEKIIPPPPNQQPCEPRTQTGSTVACESGIFEEDIPLIGTGLTLHYKSKRTAGYKYPITIPVTAATVPASLRKARVNVSLAGRVFQYELNPQPNQAITVEWDGRDHLGKKTTGAVSAHVTVSFDYPLNYASAGRGGSVARAFGKTGYSVIAQRSSQNVSASLAFDYDLAIQTGPPEGSEFAEGWTLSEHHRVDPSFQTVWKGNGDILQGASTGFLEPVAGGGTFTGDGKPALETKISADMPGDVAVAADGSILFIDGGRRLRAVGPDNIVRTVAGNGAQGNPGANDGALATEVGLGYIMAFHIAPDNTIYFVETTSLGSSNSHIRHITSQGRLETVAKFISSDVTDVELGPDGSIYVTREAANKLTKISPDGTITDIASVSYWPWGVNVREDGSIYVSTAFGHRVDIIRPNGKHEQISVNSPQDVTWDDAGNMYIASSLYSYPTDGIYLYTTSGSLTRISGGASDPGPSPGAPINKVRIKARSVFYSKKHGGVLFPYGNRIYLLRDRVSSRFNVEAGERAIPDMEASQAYIFTSDGRHLRTVDLDSGKTLLTFGYTADGRLLSVTDRFDNVTTIERDGTGAVTGIVGPDGDLNHVVVNAGRLNSITYADGSSYEFAYSNDGLMTRKTDPNREVFLYTYDEHGRVYATQDPLGAETHFSVTTERDQLIATTTDPEGRALASKYKEGAAGSASREWIDKAGNSAVLTTNSYGLSNTLQYPDGTTSTILYADDSYYDEQRVQSVSIRLQSGKTTLREFAVSYTDSNADGVLEQATHTQKLNGKSYTLRKDLQGGSVTLTSPAGRKMTSSYDPSTLLVSQVDIPGIESIQYAYDNRGRLTEISQEEEESERRTLLTYNSQGRVATLADALGRAVGFEYDALGRIVEERMPDGREIRYTYDSNGNLTSITPPHGSVHVLHYTPVNLQAEYAPPDIGAGTESTVYSYNLAKQLTSITRPDGKRVDFSYDNGARLSTLVFSRGAQEFTYNASGQLASIKTPEGVTLEYSYDGFLMSEGKWSGDVSGSMSRTYDSDLRITGIAVNGSTVNFEYDSDGLLTRSGDLSFTRNAQNGLLTGSSVGNVTAAYAYNGFGEIATHQVTFSGSPLYKVEYTHDRVGRVISKTESSDGTSRTFTYTFDVAGRLTEEKQDGTVVGSYTYDTNGNRLSHLVQGGSVSASYDAQDRLISYGEIGYIYTANGELESKTEGDNITRYDYDELGNLLGVTLPDGTDIDYLIDGNNRRIGKKVNGILVKGFLYQDGLNPVAELDAGGDLLTRFVYGSRSNLPDYMIKSGTTYRIIADHLGSPRLVVDVTTGQIAQRMDYDAFGKVTADTNPGFQPFGFAGGLYDPDTDLVRFGFRDYDADTGRFTAKDPILFAGGNTNLYGYCLNDPVNWVDPYGLWTLQVGLSFTAGGIVGSTKGVGIVVGMNPQSGESQFGWYAVGGAGPLGGAGASITADVTWSSNPCIQDVSGWASTGGGSVTPLPPLPVTVGAEMNTPLTGSASRSYTWSAGLATGTPYEGHGFVTYIHVGRVF